MALSSLISFLGTFSTAIELKPGAEARQNAKTKAAGSSLALSSDI
jgi:hypothetical protein